MLLEIAQPVSFLLCLLSLWHVFYAAFLAPASDPAQRIVESLGPLALSAAISLISGMIFREVTLDTGVKPGSLASTLPVRLFFWSAGAILVLFLASWYLETHSVLYRDVRRL
jgi:hypothetical protein